MMAALHHRKILIAEPNNFTTNYATDCYLCYVCPENCYLSPPPPQLLPQPPQFADPNPIKSHVPTVLILMLCVLGVAFLVLSYLTLARYRRRRNLGPMEPSRTNFADENQGPMVDHPIWYIRTVGLPQTAIDAIASFPYRKADGLVDGNDCAVCLNDFRDGEAVRLLPKCSHAFHLDCIDTWLRSHKNCPVCRAAIVAGEANSRRAEASSSSPQRNPAELRGGVRRSVSMDLSCASNSSIYRAMKRSLSLSGKRSLRKDSSSSSPQSFLLQEIHLQIR
ncbi:E3 ubiquitin-protein ligase RING1-like [Salvia miltiorrhiza]|uniref:E3 ubiquitin-protein ligase RING1-like n=1 Tax=Salvia miltiorrhiza TaxID=226208 RepID=UPI0025AD85FF|nr:E3 ubiquitin-protein ligase RING1-like [Salvia miltiorrhiza]